MRPNLILIIPIIFFCLQPAGAFSLFGSDVYRVETICLTSSGKLNASEKCGDGYGSQAEFVFPPNAKLKFDKNGLKPKYKYHLIEIDGLLNNYSQSVNAVDRARYYTAETEDRDKFDNSKCRYCGIYVNGGKVIISFNYEDFLADPGKTKNNFNQLAIELFAKLTVNEGNRKSNKSKWSFGISQYIVEKIFEFVPFPFEGSLSRYVSQINKNGSFILINPKFSLKVDAVEKVEDGDDWYFNLKGTNIIKINRDSDGIIIQNPFHKFQENVLPNNIVKDNVVLQSSTEDIQLSNSLKEIPYVFLWQNNFKQNNKGSSPGSCAETDANLIRCTSILVHFSNPSAFYDPDINDLNFENTKISSFGFRNLINPITEITVNGKTVEIPLGMRFYQLKNQLNIPSSAEFYRFWKDKYIKLKTKNIDDLLLLPNDQITF